LIPENRIGSNNITNKNRNRSRAFIAFSIIESILIFSIVLLYYLTLPMTSSKILFIPKGSTNNIINYLNKSGYEMNILDEVVIKATGFIQSGWIDIGETNLTKMDFIIRLVNSKAAMKNITLVPGETYYVFLKKLAKEFELNERNYIKFIVNLHIN